MSLRPLDAVPSDSRSASATSGTSLPLKPGEYSYQKVEIDNAVCNRRFHVAFEEGQKPVAKTQVTCPHCGIIVWEAENHVPGVLLREENLVKNPDGTHPMIYECKFQVS